MIEGDPVPVICSLANRGVGNMTIRGSSGSAIPLARQGFPAALRTGTPWAGPIPSRYASTMRSRSVASRTVGDPPTGALKLTERGLLGTALAVLSKFSRPTRQVQDRFSIDSHSF